ncbi:MAG: CoA transferase, partial [Planctomycetaceae bacterium]|nr:CoA transferase [Planctomycetaceae bacterium]
EEDQPPVPLSPIPLRMGELVRTPLQPAPRLGEHTDSVLEELGFTKQDVARLREQEVV